MRFSTLRLLMMQNAFLKIICTLCFSVVLGTFQVAFGQTIVDPPQEPGTGPNGDLPPICSSCFPITSSENISWQLVHEQVLSICNEIKPYKFGFNTNGMIESSTGESTKDLWRYTFKVFNPPSPDPIENVNRGYNTEALVVVRGGEGSDKCQGIGLFPKGGSHSFIGTMSPQTLLLGTRQGITSKGISITSENKVGINTLSPTETFEVNGTTLLNGNTEVAGSLTANPGTTNSGQLWQVNSLGQTAWVNPTSVFNITGEANKIAKFTGGANGLTESDIFNEGGKVRIGDASGDFDHKLQVNEVASSGMGNLKKVFKASAGNNSFSFSTEGLFYPRVSYLDFGFENGGGPREVRFRYPNPGTGAAPTIFFTSTSSGSVSLGAPNKARCIHFQ